MSCWATSEVSSAAILSICPPEQSGRTERGEGERERDCTALLHTLPCLPGSVYTQYALALSAEVEGGKSTLREKKDVSSQLPFFLQNNNNNSTRSSRAVLLWPSEGPLHLLVGRISPAALRGGGRERVAGRREAVRDGVDM
jgi:hypothetical protein